MQPKCVCVTSIRHVQESLLGISCTAFWARARFWLLERHFPCPGLPSDHHPSPRSSIFWHLPGLRLISPYVIVYFNKNTRLLTEKLSNLFSLWAQPHGTVKDSCKVLLFKKFWLMSAEKALGKQMNNWLLSFHIATAFLGSHDSFVNHSCRPNAITLEKWWLFLGGFFCGHSCQDQSCNGLLLWPLLFH